jgi:hypothetical protein
MIQFPIKLERAETDITRLAPYSTTPFLTSTPPLLPVRFLREFFYSVRLTHDSYFTPRSESPDPISMRRVDAQR